MHHSYLDAIKSFEGYTPKAEWDYAQFTNGYGTKALHAGEAISPEEAERRFAAEIAVARGIVEKHAAGWDEGTKAALTSLTFNAGSRWTQSGLGEAVRNQDIEAVKERFLQYTKAGGEVLPGLLRRRLAEVDWIGSGAPPSGTASPAKSIGPAIAAAAALDAQAAARTQQSLFRESTTAAILPQGGAFGTPASPLNASGAAPANEGLEDVRSQQALSQLVSLMFDLQMRSALADPMKSTETSSERQARTT